MLASGYLLFQNKTINTMHTAAKTTPQMQKKVANPKAIHGTTRMTVAGGFGIPSVSSGVQQGTTLYMVVQYMYKCKVYMI